MEGADLTVDITVHKAVKTKETAIVSVMKKKVGDILPPYVPLKEEVARKSETLQRVQELQQPSTVSQPSKPTP